MSGLDGIGFGLCRVKREGGVMHLDDPTILGGPISMGRSDAWYTRQMEAYIADTGDKDAWRGCIREYLAPKTNV